MGNQRCRRTNVATSILNKYTKDPIKQKQFEDSVSLLRILQGKEIDSVKTGVRWNLTKNLRDYLKKLPYFLLFNYEKKMNSYRKLKREPKFDDNGWRISNAYHSPSAMNELCNYVDRWEKQLDWADEQIQTGYLLIDNKLSLSDKAIMREIRTLLKDFYDDWRIALDEKDVDQSVNLDLCLEKYKGRILQMDCDQELLANYFIKVSYESKNTNKTLCWYVFSETIIKNLVANSPLSKSTKIVENVNGQYEFLGKRYDMLEGVV